MAGRCFVFSEFGFGCDLSLNLDFDSWAVKRLEHKHGGYFPRGSSLLRG